MPSLWSWLSRGKHNINSSKQSDYIKTGEDQSRHRNNLNPGLQNKEVTKSKDLSSVQQKSSLSNDRPGSRNLSAKTNRPERPLEVETKNEERKLGDVVQDHGAPKRRVLAYEIFNDTYKPTEKASKDISNYQSSLDKKDSSHYSQEVRGFPQRHDKETVDISDVEMRPKNYNIFGGLASRLQRHSLQSAYPGHRVEIRQGLECRRNETMAGYVPRAVSLHDASAILSGGVKEVSPSKHMYSKLDHFPKTHDWMPGRVVSSSHQLQRPPPSRKHSAPFSNNLVGNVRHSKDKGANFVEMSAQSSNKSNQRTSKGNHSKSSSGNENFYFSSSILSPILNEAQTIKPLSGTDVGSLEPHSVFKSTSAQSSADPTSCSNDLSHTHSNSQNKNSDSSDNFWLTKTHLNNSSDFYSNLHNDIRSDKNNTDEHRDEGVASILAQFDKTVEDSLGRKDMKYLDGIFTTEGDVLY